MVYLTRYRGTLPYSHPVHMATSLLQPPYSGRQKNFSRWFTHLKNPFNLAVFHSNRNLIYTGTRTSTNGTFEFQYRCITSLESLRFPFADQLNKRLHVKVQDWCEMWQSKAQAPQVGWNITLDGFPLLTSGPDSIEALFRFYVHVILIAWFFLIYSRKRCSWISCSTFQIFSNGW